MSVLVVWGVAAALGATSGETAETAPLAQRSWQGQFNLGGSIARNQVGLIPGFDLQGAVVFPLGGRFGSVDDPHSNWFVGGSAVFRIEAGSGDNFGAGLVGLGGRVGRRFASRTAASWFGDEGKPVFAYTDLFFQLTALTGVAGPSNISTNDLPAALGLSAELGVTSSHWAQSILWSLGTVTQMFRGSGLVVLEIPLLIVAFAAAMFDHVGLFCEWNNRDPANGGPLVGIRFGFGV